MKASSGNNQIKHISLSPPISLFIRIIFLLIFLSFTISFLLKRNPTIYTTLYNSPPIHHEAEEDEGNISSIDGSQDTSDSSRPARRLYNFTDFSQSLNKTGRKFWESIKPSFDCPQDLLLKVGGTKDGGKWTCGITNLEKLTRTTGFKNGQDEAPCLVYSFGVNRDSSFEAEVLATTYCQVYAYDPSVDKIGSPLRPSNPRVHFKKLGISGNDSGNKRTLKTLMEENGGHEWIDILKMDVEFAEYASLERILKDFPSLDNSSSDGGTGGGLPFGQLLVEMHVGRWNKKKTDKFSAAEIVANLFTRLEERGLRMFYTEINPIVGGHSFSEFSFINTNELSIERFLGNE